MPVPAHYQKVIDDFFSAIEPFKAAYGEGTFSYIAVKFDSKFVLLQSYVHLTGINNPIFSHFSSVNVRAGRYRLTDLAKNAHEFLNMALAGKIVTPGGELYLLPDNDGFHSAWVQLFHPVGLQNQNRMTVLKVTGIDKYRLLQQPQLDWELKAQARPYDGIQDLMNEYSLGFLEADKSSIELVAYNIAAIDFSSPVSSDSATVIVRLARGLTPEKFSIGIRTFQKSQIIDRFRKDGSEFQWMIDSGFQIGSLTIPIPEAAVLHCIANYDGVAQHYGWLTNPLTALNARRAAYETFDPKLTHLKEVFGRTSFRGHDARELESAVSWLLWMLGLSVAHLGAVPKMQEAIDLFVTSPSGHIAVVEVTTGTLKAENKLALLHDRAQSVRRNLEASGNRHIKVLAVIVTSQPRADVEVDIEQAEKLGILVVTNETLQKGIEQSAIPQNPEKFFEDAENQIKLALDKHQGQAALPFPSTITS